MRPIPVFMALMLVVACSVHASPWQGQEVVEGGVRHVRNAATPMEKPLTLQLEKLWRVGGDSEADGEFFGVITDIGVHPSGEVYLLDMQLSEVKVFSASGEYLRSIGREGEGPGEFRRPSSLFFDPQGNVGVVQMQPSRVVMLDPKGTPATLLALPNPEDGGFRMLSQGAYRGGSLVVQGSNFRRAENAMERTSALVRLDPSGKEVARFHATSSSTSMAKMVIREDEFGFSWTVGPQGNVYAALDRTWKVQVWNPDGSVERVIELDYKPVMRTPAEMEAERKRMSSRIMIRGPGGRLQPEFEVSDRERDIQWLAVADDGHLWVLSSRGVRDLPAGTIGHFDVFDAQGRYVQRVTLKGEGSFEEDRLVLAGECFFVIKQFAAAARAMRGAEAATEGEAAAEELPEPMSVLCYRMKWTPGQAVAAPKR